MTISGISTENMKIISQRFPKLYSVINRLETSSFKVKTTLSKSGMTTLFKESDGKLHFIHSQYNPMEEAERVVARYNDVVQYQHLLFFGVGLGYHIKAFIKKYPHLTYSIIEPDPEILYHFFCNNELKEVHPKIKHISLVDNLVDNSAELMQIIRLIDEETLLITFPIYEQLFRDLYQQFQMLLRAIIKERITLLAVNNAYQKKWTLNSIKNFPQILNTPNILEKTRFFKNKPALIVAAGPSLIEEIPHLRKIKQNGLAYIFAAGSGLIPLLNNQIIPDAICVYDPNNAGKVVFQKLADEGLENKIPLIFGSSVGDEIPQMVTGFKFHFINDQDTIAPYYLGTLNDKSLGLIKDSSSVTIILVQILAKLGCNPIVFVGQNLAYKNDEVYAQGIDYYNTKLNSKQIAEIIQVESVSGDLVNTCRSYELMRDDLENCIAQYRDVNFYNTTKDGAKIKGTSFIHLCDLVKQHLTGTIVKNDWLKCGIETYDRILMLKQDAIMVAEFNKFDKIIKNNLRNIEVMKTFESFDTDEANQLVVKWGEHLKELLKNLFYQVFLKRMLRIELEFLEQALSKVEFENDTSKKYQHILENYQLFTEKVFNDWLILKPLYLELQKTIFQLKDEEQKRCNDV